VTETPRTGQLAALNTILARWERGEPYTAVVAPTRYGKSDIIRMASLLGAERGLITTALVLSPTGFLVKQLTKADKWKKCLERFTAEWLTASGFPTISFQPKYAQLPRLKLRPNANGEHLLSATVQLVQRNADIFGDWAESVLAITGRPVAVFMDESHTGSESNEWGKTLKLLASRGALIVLLTATAERSDGKPIPGFRSEVIDAQQTTVYVPGPGSKPELIRVDVYEGIKQRVRLKPDVEIPFKQAFDEDALAKISHITIDVDLAEIALGTYSGMLSELSASRVPGALDKLVRHPDVIRQGCQDLVTNLRWFRERQPNGLAIIYTGNDEERHGASRGDNRHAKQVRDELGHQAPEFDVKIFTSQDEEAEDHLLAFCDGGYGDVAIVKQMAGLGLDSDLLKVGLDLSTTRTFAASVQRMMRVATPPPLMSVWISPADILSKANFKRIVTDQGGEIKSVDLELIQSYEVERKEKDKEVWRVGMVTTGDFDDSQEYHGDKEERPVVEQFLARFPALRSEYSDAYIATNLRGVLEHPEITSTTAARNTGIEADAIRIEINQVADAATDALTVGRGLRWGQYNYGETRKKIFVSAYKSCTWPYGAKVEDVSDLALLSGLRDALQRVHAYVLRGGSL
jgi:hypothetical protein